MVSSRSLDEHGIPHSASNVERNAIKNEMHSRCSQKPSREKLAEIYRSHVAYKGQDYLCATLGLYSNSLG